MELVDKLYSINKTVGLNIELLLRKKRVAYIIERDTVDQVLPLIVASELFACVTILNSDLIVLRGSLEVIQRLAAQYRGHELIGHLLGYEYPTNDFATMDAIIVNYFACLGNEETYIYGSKVPTQEYDKLKPKIIEQKNKLSSGLEKHSVLVRVVKPVESRGSVIETIC